MPLTTTERQNIVAYLGARFDPSKIRPGLLDDFLDVLNRMPYLNIERVRAAVRTHAIASGRFTSPDFEELLKIVKDYHRVSDGYSDPTARTPDDVERAWAGVAQKIGGIRPTHTGDVADCIRDLEAVGCTRGQAETRAELVFGLDLVQEYRDAIDGATMRFIVRTLRRSTGEKRQQFERQLIGVYGSDRALKFIDMANSDADIGAPGPLANGFSI